MKTHKICTGCRRLFLLDEFHKDRRKEDGHGARCKYCCNEWQRKYAENNPEISKARNQKYYQSNKQNILVQHKEYHSINSDWYSNYHRAYLAEHRDDIRARKVVYVSTHRENYIAYGQNRRSRKRQNGGHFTGKEWEELCRKYGNRCLRCNRIDVQLSADHVVPIIAGGSNNIENIQPLCKSCNSIKGTKTIDYRL